MLRADRGQRTLSAAHAGKIAAEVRPAAELEIFRPPVERLKSDFNTGNDTSFPAYLPPQLLSPRGLLSAPFDERAASGAARVGAAARCPPGLQEAALPGSYLAGAAAPVTTTPSSVCDGPERERRAFPRPQRGRGDVERRWIALDDFVPLCPPAPDERTALSSISLRG